MKKHFVPILTCIAAHLLPILYLGIYYKYLADNFYCDLRLKFTLTMFVFPAAFGLLLCAFIMTGIKDNVFTIRTILICLSVLLALIVALYATGVWMHLSSYKDALIMVNMLPAAWAVLLFSKYTAIKR